MESSFDFQNISRQPPLAIVQVCGAIGTATVSKFQDEMNQLQAQGYIYIILDMAGIDYISSVGMGTLVNYTDALDSQQGALVLIRVQPKISDLFEMLSLKEYVHIFDTQEEAMFYFQSKAGLNSSEPEEIEIEISEGNIIPETIEEEFYSFEQAQKELQTDDDHLRRLIDDGDLEIYPDNHQKMRFKVKDIRNYKRLIEGEKSMIIPSKDEPTLVEEDFPAPNIGKQSENSSEFDIFQVREESENILNFANELESNSDTSLASPSLTPSRIASKPSLTPPHLKPVHTPLGIIQPSSNSPTHTPLGISTPSSLKTTRTNPVQPAHTPSSGITKPVHTPLGISNPLLISGLSHHISTPQIASGNKPEQKTTQTIAEQSNSQTVSKLFPTQELAQNLEVNQTQGPGIVGNIGYKKIPLRLYDSLKKNQHFGLLIEKIEQQIQNDYPDEPATAQEQNIVNQPTTQEVKENSSKELLDYWEKICKPPLGVAIVVLLFILATLFILDMVVGAGLQNNPTVLVERVQEILIPQTLQESVPYTPTTKEYQITEGGRIETVASAGNWVKEGDIIAYRIGSETLCQELYKYEQELQKLKFSYSDVMMQLETENSSNLKKQSKELSQKIREVSSKMKQKEKNLTKTPIHAQTTFILKEWTKNVKEPLIDIKSPIFLYQEFDSKIHFEISSKLPHRKGENIYLQVVSQKIHSEETEQKNWLSVIVENNYDPIQQKSFLYVQLPLTEIKQLSLEEKYQLVFSFEEQIPCLAINEERIHTENTKQFLILYKNSSWQKELITVKKTYKNMAIIEGNIQKDDLVKVE